MTRIWNILIWNHRFNKLCCQLHLYWKNLDENWTTNHKSSHSSGHIQEWIINHMPGKLCDEITSSFLNFNGYTVEFREWISNFIPYFIMDVITYPCIVNHTSTIYRVCYIIAFFQFVAHSSCQQKLTTIWYGEVWFMEGLHRLVRPLFFLGCALVYPLLALSYIFAPTTKVRLLKHLGLISIHGCARSGPMRDKKHVTSSSIWRKLSRHI